MHTYSFFSFSYCLIKFDNLNESFEDACKNKWRWEFLNKVDIIEKKLQQVVSENNLI